MVLDVAELGARFTWADYLVFALMLLVSAGIGVFYGCFGKKQDSKEFLMAGKSMTTFPVAMSLIASFMSAITLLGTPSEVYQFGMVYWLIGWSYFIVMPAAAYLYLPVFYDLQVTSAYEYLELRFHRSVRMLGSATFIVQMTLYMAIVVYAPALALAQVTGLNVYVSVCLICFVCIFYTTLGGMKAVLWTDTIQVVIMYASMVFVVIKGAVDIGGFAEVWRINDQSGRTELFNWDPNPSTRHTFWTLIVGGYFTWITIYGVNQAQVQRYMCVQTKRMAMNALWINLIGLFFLMMVCAFAGLVIYAKYADCDPVASGTVSKGDQLFPLFVMDTLGHWRGLPGLFVAGIFSGALSTVSSGMNSLAAITLEDFIKAGCYPNLSEKRATLLSKLLSLLYGLLTFALVFVAERLGNILSAALSIFGIVGGPLLGVFTLGMFFPWANSKGAFVGLLTGLTFTFWIGVGQQMAMASGQLVNHPKPISVSGCNFTENDYLTNNLFTSLSPEMISTVPDIEPPFGLYTLSYMWFSATGCFTVITVGLLVTLATGIQDIRTLDVRTLSPAIIWFRKWIPGLEGLGEDFGEAGSTLQVDKKAWESSQGGIDGPGGLHCDFAPHTESSQL